MAESSENAPLSELVGGLVSDVTGLLRKEIDLAKTEALEKFSQALTGVEVLIFGLVLAIGAVGVLLSAVVGGLAAFLVAQGFTDTGASALASLIVGIVVALIAWILVSRGIAALRGANMTLNRTASMRTPTTARFVRLSICFMSPGTRPAKSSPVTM
jgi:TM2 domain-containing membrane protein YozV